MINPYVYLVANTCPHIYVVFIVYVFIANVWIGLFLVAFILLRYFIYQIRIHYYAKLKPDILKKGETKTPTFDFPSHSRTDKWKKCQVSKNGVVIMEGIHALNPIICEGLDNDKIYRVYVHCNTNFVFKNKV